VDAADLLAAAVPLLLVAGAFQMVDAIQVIGAGLLRGLKDTRIPMIIAVISYWPIGLSAAYGLGFGLGLAVRASGQAWPSVWALQRCCSMVRVDGKPHLRKHHRRPSALARTMVQRRSSTIAG
jgi:Na+-driven multidrug efflux pump